MDVTFRTGSKASEQKFAELEGSRGKMETELQEKIKCLEKELENTKTSLDDFKRRGEQLC